MGKKKKNENKKKSIKKFHIKIQKKKKKIKRINRIKGKRRKLY